MTVVGALVLTLSLSSTQATDPLSQANDAFRNGEYSKAAELFEVAADLERRPEVRSEIRVKLAWTQFALQRKDKAEAALAGALEDKSDLELSPDFFPDDFLALFARVKARVRSTTTAPLPSRTVTGDTLASLRARIDQAADPAAIESILWELQEIESSAPSSFLPEVFDIRAAILDRLGRTEEALESLGRAAALRATVLAGPNRVAAPYDTMLEARRLTANGQPSDAAALMRGVLAAQPTCAPALEVLGEAYLAAGRFDESRAALRTAIVADPKLDLLLALGEVEMRRADPAAAREAFRQAVEIAPGNDRALASLGLVAASLHDLPAARDALDKAIAINGTLVEALVMRAQIALADSDGATALRHSQRALQIRSDDPWVRGWLGIAILAKGDAAAALDLLAGATEPPLFAVCRAEALRRLGRTRDALDALAAAPSSPDAVLVAARCHLDRQRPEEALAVLATRVDQAPRDGRIRFMIAAARAALGDRQNSLAELQATALPDVGQELIAAAVANLDATLAADLLMRAAEVPLQPAPKR